MSRGRKAGQEVSEPIRGYITITDTQPGWCKKQMRRRREGVRAKQALQHGLHGRYEAIS